MPDTSRFLTALGRVLRSLTGPGRGQGRSDVAEPPRSEDGQAWPGRTGPSATVELDPGAVRRVRFSYTPERDGEPDPGEVVWTWVPYEERDGRGKDRPVVVVAAGAPGEFLAVQLTSTPHDHDRDAIALGAGAWGPAGPAELGPPGPAVPRARRRCAPRSGVARPRAVCARRRRAHRPVRVEIGRLSLGDGRSPRPWTGGFVVVGDAGLEPTTSSV